LIEHYFKNLENQNTSNYFVYRFGQPKQLVALALASLTTPEYGPALDLGCGAGHITRYLMHRYDPKNVVGIDSNFFLLYVAQTHIAPNTAFVCCDLEQGIPFKSDTFGFVTMSNFYHFLFAKRFCINEVNRIARDEAIISATSIRHQDFPTPTPNQSLTIEAYTNLFATRPLAIVSDTDLLNRYLQNLGPDLSSSRIPIDLRTEPLISILASKNLSVFKNHRSFERFPHAIGNVALNPIYEITDTESNGDTYLRLNFPSKQYIEDNPGMESYLPPDAVFEASLQKSLGKIDNNDLPAEAKPLIKSMVLMDIPESY